MIDAESERVRPSGGPGFSEWVSVAWGDLAAGRFGLARVGLAPGPNGGPARASAVAVLFAGGEVAASELAGEVEIADPDWSALRVGPLAMETVQPLREWRVWHQEAFDLRLEAQAPPAELAAAGGEGYEQVCRVRGQAGGLPVDAVGQRGHGWGALDWDALGSVRSVSAWLEGGDAVLVRSAHPAGAAGHEGDAVTGALVEVDGPVALVVPVDEARLSTTWDAHGRQRRAGLELWIGEEDEFPRRAAGEAVCGTTLELGRLRMDLAFLRWEMEGRGGAGRYEVLRRA